MADLIDLTTYKSLMGVDTADTRNDAQISALLPTVTRTVKTFTGRDFEVNTGIATARSYQYDGTGMLDIDDCTSVTLVSTDAGIPGQSWDLDTRQWTVMPQDGSDVFYYLLLHGGPYSGSPEMGFERNLDTYLITPKLPMITVTATWGWPAIPDDVKLAAALIVRGMVGDSGERDEDLTAESIEGFARSWGNKQSGATALVVPNRARDLLAMYARVMI